MITWISTIGWSPFAAINPIWAYCKEYNECPSKFVFLYTDYEKVSQNLELVKSYIREIIGEYSKTAFKEENIIIHDLISDDIQNYANSIKKIISMEISIKPEKIILDMTPGRKYMSAINVYIGLQRSNIPILVFYLHLEERKYQDIPFPLTPIVKNELIDIIDSTEIFTKPLDNKEDFNVKDSKSHLKELINKVNNHQEKIENLILLAISKNLSSKNKIRQFLFDSDHSIRGSELRKILKKLENQSLIKSEIMTNNSTEYKGYEISNKGLEKLTKLENE
ncbi:MAG: hypothetical protein P8Y70_21345 [Candidatus Lokiarchaeota archaeon]